MALRFFVRVILASMAASSVSSVRMPRATRTTIVDHTEQQQQPDRFSTALSSLSRVETLPGWNTATDGPFPELYSGYLAADPLGEARLFTIYAPASPTTTPRSDTSAPHTDTPTSGASPRASDDGHRASSASSAASGGDTLVGDTLVWFQGGPGCSSMIAFTAENGPLRVRPGGSLARNEYAWVHQGRSMAWITSPPCVGFSQIGQRSCDTGDNATAAYNLFALEQLLEAVPQTAATRVVLTGESYAGSYLFFLADAIVNRGSRALQAAFGAIVVGNPVMSCGDWRIGHNDTQVELYYWHGVIPLRLRNAWFDSCAVSGGSRSVPATAAAVVAGAGDGGSAEARALAGSGIAQDPVCDTIMADILDAIGPLDPDNLYTDTCTGNASLAFDASPAAAHCDSLQSARNAYLNVRDVQAALHADPPLNPLGWVPCSNPPFLNYTSDWPDLLPFYREIFAKRPDVAMMVYSGDVDIATCPHAYTQLCLGQLSLSIKDKWRRWAGPNGQTAGYVETYHENNLVFATIKGAGHEVPTFQPLAAYLLVDRFLSGNPI